MDIYFETTVSILKVIPVSNRSWVAGQLVSSEVCIMRGETKVVSEWEGLVLAELLKGTIEGWSVLRNHEFTEFIKGNSLLLGEVYLCDLCGWLALLLIILEEIYEILSREVLLHIVFQRFYLLSWDFLIDLLELQPTLHQLHYSLKLIKSNLSVICILFFTHEVHNRLKLFVFLHS